MMRHTISAILQAAVVSIALVSLAPAHAQRVELLVKHRTVSTGPDGVTRSTEFSERLIRTRDTLWISRVLPLAVHSDHDHDKGSDPHKHLDIATASRWISRTESGTIALKLVPNNEKVLVNVTQTDYENVGFDGSWAAAWSLIDPAALKRMKSAPPAGDLITYTLTDKERNLKVVWNAKLQLPVRVESSDKTLRRQTMVQVLGSPAALPWEKLRDFTQKDYSDYLD